MRKEMMQTTHAVHGLLPGVRVNCILGVLRLERQEDLEWEKVLTHVAAAHAKETWTGWEKFPSK